MEEIDVKGFTPKYRAWHIPTKRMFPVHGVHNDFVFEDTLDGVFSNETNPAKRQDCILMPFTGQYDKNGKEIYLFDIKREEFSIDDTLGIDMRNYYIVLWINVWSRFAWIMAPDFLLYGEDLTEEDLDYILQETYGLFEDEKDATIVCGNLFENQDLLYKD